MSQAEPHRKLTLDITGAPDGLTVIDASIASGIGRPPILTASVHLPASIEPSELIGKRGRFEMRAAKRVQAALVGEVRSAAILGWDDGHVTGTIELVGAPLAISVGHQTRAYTEMTAPDILTQLLRRHEGLQVDNTSLRASYSAIEYCVQYHESDLDFAQRIAKANGIGLLFRAQNFPTKVLLLDDARDFLKHNDIEFRTRVDSTAARTEEITNLGLNTTVTAAAYLQDTRFHETPKKALRTSASGLKATHDPSESVDTRAAYSDVSFGRAIATARAHSDDALATQISAQTTSVELESGNQFKLSGHPHKKLNCTYFVTAAHLQISGTSSLSGAQQDAPIRKDLRLQTHPKTAVLDFAAPPPPFETGLLSAVVVGDKAGEVTCDKNGRIKVKFVWMGISPNAGDSEQSFWVRVSTPWAGSTRGLCALPRVGDEVLVAFEHGDPSQPIIVGSVFNGDLRQPTSLTSQKSTFVIRSRTVPGGGPDAFNELRMEDNKGEERLYLKAQRDMEEEVSANLKTTIGKKAAITATEEYKIEVGSAKLLLKPDSIRLELGPAELELDASGQVVLNGQIIRIG